MEGLFPRRAFTEFGPNALSPSDEPAPLTRVRGRRPADLRRQVRRLCPRAPGVYGMIDAAGDLIYVGKAKSLRARLLCYFRPRSRDPKAGRVVRQARQIVWEAQPSEFAALLRELELIRRWQPRCNVQGQPRRRRRVYVCLGRRPAPYVYLDARPRPTALACFGPVPAGGRAREAVRRLNDWYGLRDCPQSQEMAFADQQELFPADRGAGCLRHELGTCLGPCAAACTRSAYLERVRASRAFLAGTDDTPLQALERGMAEAAAALAFERAASLRDRRDALRWLRDRLDHLRRGRERQSFVYAVGEGDDAVWYLVRDGLVVRALRAPGDAGGRRTTAETVREVFRAKRPRQDHLSPEEVDGVLLVAAWFRRHPEERARTTTPGAACLPCP